MCCWKTEPALHTLSEDRNRICATWPYLGHRFVHPTTIQSVSYTFRHRQHFSTLILFRRIQYSIENGYCFLKTNWNYQFPALITIRSRCHIRIENCNNLIYIYISHFFSCLFRSFFLGFLLYCPLICFFFCLNYLLQYIYPFFLFVS